MRFRIKGHVFQIFRRIVGGPRKKCGMGAGIGEKPHIIFLVIVADICKQHRRAGNHFKNLHGQRAVHVGLRSGHNRLVRPVEIVRIVQKGFRHIHGHIPVRQVAVRFNAHKVQLSFVDNFPESVVRANLGFQLFRRQSEAVILNGTHMRRQPFERLLYPACRNRISGPNNVILFNVFHIDAKALLPFIHIRHRRIHSQRAAAKISERQAPQPHRSSRSLQKCKQLPLYLRIMNRTP